MPALFTDMLTTIVSFVVVLSVVVFVHEFGHFRVGRWCGMAVKSFSIGLGSELFGWTDRHGTRWKVSRIPLGGFVSWVDDTDGSSTRPSSEEDRALSADEARSLGHFRAMPLWKRAITVAAGPVANFVFAIFAFAVLALAMGKDVTDINAIPARIAQVSANSPAAAAGLASGDVIRAVDGRAIASFTDLQRAIASAGPRSLELTVARGDETLSVSVMPREQNGRLLLGVSGPLVLQSERVVETYGLLESIGAGAGNTWVIVAQTGVYLWRVVTGRESGDQIAGVIGIANTSGQVATSALNAPGASIGERMKLLALSLLSLAAMLSVAVGIVNLLPIPVLDGGHLVFYAIEAVRGGRPLPAAAQEWAYRAGFAVMASLFLFATWNDITRLFPGAH
jgi:regulator of sigma E protease